ncbi:acyl-CoA dehydrogenase family protein [Dactylosporangium sp. CA-092794]|uniref:acyl-CoA dehydrogenase family protein n=1 Tax=Dactylosporangium sp. CA-092794 TaxID=3239929 RepID=UPI003D8BDE2C
MTATTPAVGSTAVAGRPSGAPPAGAARLAALAGGHAADADRRRRLSSAVVDELLATGFARHLVPARWGGTAGTFADLLTAVTLVGEGCAATAWNAAVLAIVGRMTAHLPAEGQHDIWNASPDVPLAGSIPPAGRVEAVPGGWRLSGQWGFATGVDYAQWTMLGALAPAADRPEYRFFLLPRPDYRVVDTWFTVGLRGTGSRSVAVDDAFVPAHRSFSHKALMAGTGTGSDARCHRVPFKLVNGITFAAPVLGTSRAALRHWTARMAAKTDVGGGRARDSAVVQQALARSAGEVDAAQLLLERAAAVADAGAWGDAEQVRSPRDFAIATELLADAVDRLFRVGGVRGQHENDPVQRAWRDVNSAAGHVVLQFGPPAGAFAAHLLDGESRNG